MKARYIFLMVILSVGMTLQAQQLPDSGFEDWSGTAFDGEIQMKYWHASNVSQAGILCNFVQRDTGRVGGYCFCVQNKAVGAMGITEMRQGFVTLGQPWDYLPGLTLNQATSGTDGGISFTYRPDSMVVWIKRVGEKCTYEDFNLLFYSWTGTAQNTKYKNKSSDCTDTGTTHTNEESDIRQALDWNECGTDTKATQVAEGWWRERQEYTDWTRIAVPIYYMNDQVPEKCNVILSAGNYPNFHTRDGINSGDSLYADDIQLIYSSKIQQLYINGERWSAFDPESEEIQIYTKEITGTPDIYAVRGAGALTNTKNTSVEFPGRRLTDDEVQITFSDSNLALITVNAGDNSSTTTYRIRFTQSSTSQQGADTCTLASGTCGAQGNNLIWKLSCDSVLTISGRGAMEELEMDHTPWRYYREAVNAIVIESGVTSIGTEAFYSCRNTRSITIGSDVAVIGSGAFYSGTNLAGITISDENPTYDSRDNCNAIIETSTNTLILGCKNTIVPTSVTEIGSSAFIYCTGLTSIEIPGSVTSIGNNAFSGSGLTNITIPNNITEISGGLFYSCRNLTSVTLSNSLKTIGMKAFYGCSALTGIEIPGSVTSIESTAFCNCAGMTSIIVDEGNTTYDSRDNCNGIVKTRTNTLITGCKTTTIPKSVTSIGKEAFMACTALTSISIPDNITSIGESAFKECSGLTSVVLPNSISRIEANTFYGCSALPCIDLPGSIISIGEIAFAACHGLANIICRAVEPPSLLVEPEEIFHGVNHEIPVYVPAESVGAYKAADGWSEFTNIYAIGSEQILSIPAACTIDGNFEDWDKVPSEILAEAQADENASKDALYRIKVFTNVDYIYFYLEFDSTSYSYTNDDAVVIGSVVDVVNIFMNIDDDPLTGWNSWMWTNSGIDYLIEGMLSNNFADVGLYAFKGNSQDEWEWEDVDAHSGITISNKVLLPNGHMAVEGSVKIATIPTELKGLKVGVLTSNPQWTETGVLPQMTIESDGSVSSQQMLEVPLNYGASKDSSETVTPEPNVITIFGEEVVITDSTGVGMDEVDILGDSTMIYTPEDNTLTLNNVDLTVGEDETTAISYTGTETLVIVLNETSTIIADTVISSTADVVITGDGELVAEGTVPIIGVPTATITFDSVTMYVHSTSSPQALRRRIKSGKRVDETGGPALSGFGNADFNKTTISPSGAMYGAVNIPDGNGGLTATNALYILNGDGEQVVLTEFHLTAVEGTGVEDIREYQQFDPTQPTYNILGLPVDASYRGIVIQNGRSYLVIDN